MKKFISVMQVIEILRNASQQVYDNVKNLSGTEITTGNFGIGAGGDISQNIDIVAEKTVLDFGNIRRDQIEIVYDKICGSSKIPISIGGDHSITREIIDALSKIHGKISLVYFDAHPDFVSSTTNYYGSVINDILSKIEIDSSVEIGIRTPEQEELDNIKKFNLRVITPFDIN